MPRNKRREYVLGAASKLLDDFLYHERPGEVGAALAAGDVTIDDVLAVFRKSLEKEQKRGEEKRDA